MLCTAIDPDLLVFRREHWESLSDHLIERFRILTLHRGVITERGHKLLMSHHLWGLLYQHFPWDVDGKRIGSLRDFRQFVIEDLSKSCFIEHDIADDDVELRPDGVTCTMVNDEEIEAAWTKLLGASASDETLSEREVLVATWDSCGRLRESPTLTVVLSDGEATNEIFFSLVWDEASWSEQIVTLDHWPDISMCVEQYFEEHMNNAGVWNAAQTRLSVECTEGFWNSVQRRCSPEMRDRLIKAVAKKVYGVYGESLGDEKLPNFRRFRVDRFWRVHYQQFDNQIVLEEFGQHDMGLGRRG